MNSQTSRDNALADEIDAQISKFREEDERALRLEEGLALYHLTCALRAVESLVGENTQNLTVRGEHLGGLMRAFGFLAEGAMRHMDREESKKCALEKRHA